MTISIIGLGFVGLTLAVSLADKGVKVYGVETNPDFYNKISKGIPTLNEKGLEANLKRNLNKNLIIFKNLEDFPSHPDTFVICVNTPLKDGKPDIDYLRNATKTVGKYMSGNELIIVRSTCPVGTTRQLKLILETELKKRNITKSINIVFASERTAEGVALKELTELPQIVGGINEETTIRAMDLFRKLTPTVIQVSSIETAEMIKLIDNSFRDVRFAYANEITLLCEKAGIDAHECITKSNMHYPRNNIPLPSPGVGGPCLTKDPYLLVTDDVVRLLPHNQSLILTGRHLNESIPHFLVEKIRKKIPINKDSPKDTKIFVMGFAYKGDPEISDVRNSPTISVVEDLTKTFKVFGHDPVVPREIIEKLNVKPVNIEEGFTNAHCVIIMNNHKKYSDLNILSLLEKSSKPCLFVDCWRLYDKKLFENLKEIIYTGVGIV